MFNSKDGYSLSDIAAVTENGRNSDGFMGNGAWWIIILFLFMFTGWGGNGFGNGGALTRSELDFTNLDSSIRGVQQGLCDGFYAMNTGMLNGFSGVQRDLCSGFNSVNQGVTSLGYQMKDCCCEVNRNIDAVRFENSQNTCQIVNAIHAEGEATRGLITQNTIQELRDNLQAAQLQLGNFSQTQALISELRPCARPAYITCSPYETATFARCGNTLV